MELRYIFEGCRGIPGHGKFRWGREVEGGGKSLSLGV